MREYTEQETVRREKLKEISSVCNPYPEKFERTHSLKDVKNLEDGTTNVSIAGRIIFMRKMGKLSFVRIRDLEGDMQLEIKIDCVGEENYAFFKKQIDTGDFIGATGEIFTMQIIRKRATKPIVLAIIKFSYIMRLISTSLIVIPPAIIFICFSHILSNRE